MKIRFLTSTFALAALAMAPAAFAQTNGSSTRSAADPPATSRVAVLNVRQAIGMTSEGKAASADMSTRFQPQQTELEGIQKQAEDIQRQLANGERTLSDEEKQKKGTQLQLLQRRFSRLQDDLNEQAQAATNEAMDTIGRKMFDVLDKYARENGYAAVIDSSQSTVVYVSPQVDITNDIVKLYDTAYPSKGGAAPAKQPGTGANTMPATKPGGTTPATNPPAKKPGGQQ
ncbi:MAG TPA: OmpH family outer membrane protein [Candidatus Acidoferrales bacterium]|nr:OmpH family outer membrane protein [Candidatus Acidoferrales bacterium]